MRDLQLVCETGVKYHVRHTCQRESVALIRRGAEGLDVTCETAPHYLTMNDSMLQEDGRFKMNPPIRSEEDREALIAGILDGTIGMIATDHAPHSQRGYGGLKEPDGCSRSETAFPYFSLYTKLVKTGVVSLSSSS